MVGLMIGFIAFLFVSTGYFGGDLIYSLDVMENWYWIIFAIIAFFSIMVSFGLTVVGAAAGHNATNDNAGILGGSFVGAMFGTWLSIIMMFKISIQLILIYWLMGSIDPQAANFDALTTKQAIALCFIILIAVIPRGKSSSKKSKD